MTGLAGLGRLIHGGYNTRRKVPYAPSSTALASPPPAAVFCAACTASVPPAFTTSEPFSVTNVYAAVLLSKYLVPEVVVVDCVLTAVLLSVAVEAYVCICIDVRVAVVNVKATDNPPTVVIV